MKIEPLKSYTKQWLRSRKLSSSTILAYQLEINRFLYWLEYAHEARRALLEPDVVLEYFSVISSDDDEVFSLAGIKKPLRTSSLQQAKRILGLWLRWCAASKLVAAEFAIPLSWDPPERASPVMKRIQNSTVAKIIKPDAKKAALKNLRGSRDNFVLSVTFWLGATPSEVANLRAHEIRITGTGLEILLPRRKAASQWVPCPKPLLHAWQAYDRLRTKGEFVITQLDASGGQLSVASICRIIRNSDLKSKHLNNQNQHINSRRLKHALVSLALENDWPAHELKYYLRRHRLSHPALEIPISTATLRAFSEKAAKAV